MAGTAVKVRGATGWIDLAYVATGPQGPAGPGVPAGGAVDQVLAKASGVDYATKWTTSPTSLPPSGAAGGDLTGTYPNPKLRPRLIYVAGDGAEQTIPSNPTRARMKLAAGGDAVLSVTAGAIAEVWIVRAVVLVRANSANDTVLVTQLLETVTSAAIATSYAQRQYWSSAGLAGYTSVPMQARLDVPAGLTRSVVAEAQSTTSLGGFAFAGGATHNSMTADRLS